MCPVEPPEGNGNVLEYRVKALEHKAKNLEVGTRLLADLGAKANEQIKVHDERHREHDRRLDDLEDCVKEIPVLRSEVAGLVDGYRAARTAFYTLGVGLIVAGVGIIYQATA